MSLVSKTNENNSLKEPNNDNTNRYAKVDVEEYMTSQPYTKTTGN